MKLLLVETFVVVVVVVINSPHVKHVLGISGQRCLCALSRRVSKRGAHKPYWVSYRDRRNIPQVVGFCL